MSVPRRIRTGKRRDDGIRIIRADEVRYPGVEMPASANRGESADDQSQWPEGGHGGLRPARDTGLALDGRRARETRLRAAQQRQQTMVGIFAVIVLGAAALGWQYSSDRQAARRPLNTELATASQAFARTGAPAAGTPVARPAEGATLATPYFASYKSLKLRLPVSVQDLTEIGFHQASYPYARHLKTHLDDADMGDAKRNRTTDRDKSAQSNAADAYLVGETLRMWRSRPGKPDSAVDVGADPGSPVYAPVSGTVVKVKRYKLYNTYDDYEIHIRPDGHPTLDVVVIHIDDVAVTPGNRVVGGVSKLAVVRKLAKSVGSQLTSYTKNGGHHTHIQVNDATDPRYKGLKDAIDMDASQPTTPQSLVE